MAPHRYSPSQTAAVSSENSRRSSLTDYGEPHKFDPSFKGPVHCRSCTDVLCCGGFFLVLLCYIGLGAVAWLHGDPRKILFPTDSQGRFCGEPGTSTQDKPLLFYFDLLKCANPAILIHLQCPTTQMCVSVCPRHFLTYSDVQQQHRRGVSRTLWQEYTVYCREGFSDTHKAVSQVLRDEDCPSMLVPSRPVMGRCLPDVSSPNDSVSFGNRSVFVDGLQTPRSVSELQEAARGVAGMLDTREVGLKILEDLSHSWSWILMGLLLALLLSLLFILLLRFTAGLMLWVTILTFLLLLTYGMWLCVLELSQVSSRPGSEVTIRDLGLHSDLQVYLDLRQTWVLLIVTLGAVEAGFLLVLLFMRRRVRIAISLLHEASKAVGQIPSSLFFPVVTVVLMTCSVSFWAFTALHLSSSGKPVYRVRCPDESCFHSNSSCDPQTFSSSPVHSAPCCPGAQCVFVFYGGESPVHTHLVLLQVFNLLVLFWCLNFSLALERCTLAGAFCSYYWSHRKHRDIPSCALYSSFSRALRFHCGSLALGSLLLSVVQLLRILLQYIQNRLRGLHSPASRFLVCCLSGCFWCLERFLRYINHNAYIMVALYGQSFCTSARDAFCLLMRNMVRVAVVDHLTDVLLVLGRLLISAAVGAVGFLFFSRKLPALQEEVPELNYLWLPLLSLLLGSYLVAHGFFSVYSTCVDTLFLCFCEDLERNDGSPERPYFMSPELHRILGKTQ